MFIATNRLQAAQGRGHELEARFSQRNGVQAQPGFLGFELWKLRTEEAHEEYLVLTRWESEAHFRAWTESEAFRQAHSGPRADFLIGPGQLSTYDVRQASGPLLEQSGVELQLSGENAD